MTRGPSRPDRSQVSRRDTLVGLLGADRSARRWVVITCALAAAGTVVSAASLVVLANLVDRVFLGGAGRVDPGTAEPSVFDQVLAGEGQSSVRGLLVAMCALVASRVALAWSAQAAAAEASARLRSGLRSRLMDGLLHPGRSGRICEVGRTGELASVVGEGVDAVDPYVTGFLPAAAAAVVGPLVVAVTVLVLDPITTLVLLFAAPMLVLLLAVIGQRTAVLTRRRAEELEWLQSFFYDLLSGLPTLIAFDRADDAADRIEEVSRHHGERTMEVLRTAFQTSLVMEWAATAATALVAVEVAFRLVSGHVEFGTALAVLLLTPEFFSPLRRLALEYHAGQSGEAAWARISPLLSGDRPEGRDRHTRTPAAHIGASAEMGDARGCTRRAAPAIDIRDLVLTHPDAGGPALDGVDLVIGAGETVALVGPSGGGKSTLAAVLLRLARPDSGAVLVDGEPLEQLELKAWRSRLAWVPQSPTLFAGTVAENLRFGSRDATDEQIRAAARAAAADKFICQLPDGYRTQLTEGGLTLSGGQRQRLAIARALVRDAALVVLDEPTAHLDEASEDEVADATRRLLSGRTALVIAHRLSTARTADRIAVMRSGRVIATGTHDQLLESSDAYRALVGDERGGLSDTAPRTPLTPAEVPPR